MKHKLAIIQSILFALAVTPSALCSTESGNPPPPISYTPPSGWSMQAVPGFEYKFAMGPAINDFRPNINVVAENYSGSLESYMTQAKQMLGKVLSDKLSIISEAEFVTDTGLRGIKMVFVAGHDLDEGHRDSLAKLGAPKEVKDLLAAAKIEPKTLYQSSYVFSDGSKVYTVTCTAPLEAKAEMSPLFDTAVKSFALSK